MFVELGLDHRKREGRAVDRTIDAGQDVRHRADVVLVAMGQDECGDASPIGLERSEVGDHQIDAEQLGFREHHAGIDEHGGIPAGDEQHVHAELAKPAERDDID